MTIDIKNDQAVFNASNGSTHVTNLIKLIAEKTITPGASLLADGKVVAGCTHAVLGTAAKGVFGIPGLILLAANSFSKSVSNKHLHQHLVCTALGTKKLEK
ncbi:MAG: hypothetical protein P8Y45_04515 [Exilibacterium sp.]